MRKNIFTLMALAAALCACNKEQMIESEVTNPEVEPSAPLVFTATMENAPESKATFDNTSKCASWEVGDQISINGLLYKANAAGTSTTFSMVGGGPAPEIRPKYVSSTDTGSYNNQPASNLVDDKGTSTRWIADKNQRTGGVWNIVVSTGYPTMLKTIKLWNAENASTYAGRRWKEIKLEGRMSDSDSEPWRTINAIDDLSDLKLEKNNYGLAGEIKINSSKPYTFYKIDVLDNEGDSYMQMSDMKFTVDPEAPYYAYFPASLFDGFSASLPSSVSETWAEGKFNMPMYAQNNTPDFQFKNLCGVLKITVKNDRLSAVKSIRVSSANKAMSGAFTVVNNTAVLTSPDEKAKTLTVTYSDAVPTTAEGTVFYVAIPAQTYRELKIELSSDGVNFFKSMTTKADTDIVVARNKIYPINHTYIPPTGALPGVFTVNPQGKKIHFSRGNLKATYNGTNYTWDFAVNQYDYGGAGNATIDNQSIGNVVDLFGWSTSSPNSFFGITTAYWAEPYSGTFVDWGTTIDNKGTWCTLSKDEWVYLFNSRQMQNSKPRYTLDITYGGSRGLVLYPDDYNGSELSGTVESLPEGVVFLPAAGFRSQSQVLPAGISGHYWSSTPHGGESYSVSITLISTLTKVDPGDSSSRTAGFSVRLVTEAH